MVPQRPLGSTGLAVGAIGLGAWQLGRSEAWPDGPDRDAAVRIVHAALDAGVTLIDTAPGYSDGESELNIGAALASADASTRGQVVLCTKFGHTPEGGSDWRAEAIEPSVRRSCERMGVEAIDVVLLHNPPAEVLAGSQGHYDVLADLRDRGVIRAYGASVDTGADIDTVLEASDAQVLEVRLSALYQEPWEAMGRARDRGVGTIIKVPLESGWLSGKYAASTRFSGVRSRWTADDVALRAGLVDELRALLPDGTSVLGGALGYLLAYNAVSSVIPGTRSVEQLTSTLAAVAEPLPAETVAAIRGWYVERLGDRPLDW